MPHHFVQSASLTYFLAALGGLLEVCATAILAVPDAKKKQGLVVSNRQETLALVGNISVQTLGSLTSNLFAPWFGPVSIVGPMALSSQLVANMIIFGTVLGLDQFNKDMRIGTYIVLVATVLLPVVGPGVQDDQNVMDLLKKWYSILWFAVLMVGMLITLVLLKLDITKYKQEWTRMAILIIARATSFAVNLTVSRAFVLDIDRVVFLMFVVIKIVSGGIYTFAIVVQSTTVTQSKFVPINATFVILINALTGIVVWEDWKVISSWVGYGCVFWLLAMGCDLLLTVTPLLISENPNYGRASVIHFSPNNKRSLYHDIIDEIEAETSSLEDEEETTSQMKGLNLEAVLKDSPSLKKLAYHQASDLTPSMRRHTLGVLKSSDPCLAHVVSKREAWMQIYHPNPARLGHSAWEENTPGNGA